MAAGVRPFQHGLGVLHAVLIYLLAIPRVAKTRQISVSPNGNLVWEPISSESEQLQVSNRIIRAAHDSRGTEASLGNESFLELDSSSEEDNNWNPKDALMGDQDKGKMQYGQEMNLSTPPPPPTEYLLFNWDAGGAWDGNRNDLNAEVGFEFTPSKNLTLLALGRHVPGRWDQFGKGGRNLFAATTVTLWSVIPKDTKGQDRSNLNVTMKLVQERVGPDDVREAGGTYNFKYLKKPYRLEAHATYRLTQDCWKGMDDVWFDNKAKKTDFWQYGLTECIEVGDGCHSDYRGGYPNKVEAEYRRLGMLNIRVESDVNCGGVVPENFKENGKEHLR